MMRCRVTIYGLLWLLVTMVGCGEVDNYPAPDATLYGRVVDGAGVPIPQRVEGATGLKLSLYDQEPEYMLPIQFYAKADGSFRNSMLFSGHYKVVLDQTNFYPVDEFLVELNRGQTQCEVRAVPFCEVRDVEVTHLGAKRVRVSFRLARQRDAGCTVVHCAVYGSVSPNVDDLAVNHNVAVSATPPHTEVQLFDSHSRCEIDIDMDDDKKFAQKYEHIVRANANRIYVRVGVMTAYDDGKVSGASPKMYVNFSTVFPVRIEL